MRKSSRKKSSKKKDLMFHQFRKHLALVHKQEASSENEQQTSAHRTSNVQDEQQEEGDNIPRLTSSSIMGIFTLF